jgi:lysophospholipase L1-like esterase
MSDPTRPLSRGRRIAFWAITLLAPPLLLWGLIEAGLRIAGRASGPKSAEDLRHRLEASQQTEVQVVPAGNLKGLVQPSAAPDVVYELKPNRSWLFLKTTTRTNSLGLRGHEYAVDKPAGARRVVGLGDSVMFGWGVEEQQSYMSALEADLTRARGAPVEVLNLAVPGYNTMQEVASLESKGLRLSPDVVLVNYCLNDWAAPFFLPNPDKQGAIVEKSLLFRVLSQRLGRNAEREAPMQGMAKVEAALDRLRSLSSEHGLSVVFFIYPQPMKPENLRKLVAMAESRGFRSVDMYAAFDDYCKKNGRHPRDLVIPEDGHPNAEAHRLMADTLLPTLLSLVARSGS